MPRHLAAHPGRGDGAGWVFGVEGVEGLFDSGVPAHDLRGDDVPVLVPGHGNDRGLLGDG